MDALMMREEMQQQQPLLVSRRFQVMQQDVNLKSRLTQWTTTTSSSSKQNSMRIRHLHPSPLPLLMLFLQELSHVRRTIVVNNKAITLLLPAALHLLHLLLLLLLITWDVEGQAFLSGRNALHAFLLDGLSWEHHLLMPREGVSLRRWWQTWGNPLLPGMSFNPADFPRGSLSLNLWVQFLTQGKKRKWMQRQRKYLLIHKRTRLG